MLGYPHPTNLGISHDFACFNIPRKLFKHEALAKCSNFFRGIWAWLFKALLDRALKRSTHEVFYDFITKYTDIFC